MSEFKNAQVTLKGNVLLSKALIGEQLTFTKILMGDGRIGSAMVMEAEQLVSPKKELNITKLKRKESVVTIGGVLSLGEVTEPFYWRELGLYAKGADNVEVLYMYGNAGDLASYISNSGLNEKLIDINVVVGNASNVSATIDSSLVFLTANDLDEHNNDENAHEALKVWVMNLFGTGDWAKYSQAEDIQGRIGINSDDDTKTTLFGILGSLKRKVLSYLDTTVSSRAPASTAVSNATWTNARATKLDNLDTTISSRAAAGQVGNTTDAGGLHGQVYNENLHQKSSDIYYLLSVLNGNLNDMRWHYSNGRGDLLDRLAYLDTYISPLSSKLDQIINGLGKGDYANRTLAYESATITLTTSNQLVLAHAGNGLSKLSLDLGFLVYYTLVVDGVTVINNVRGCDIGLYQVGKETYDSTAYYPSGELLLVPYKSSFHLYANGEWSTKVSAFHYN